MAIATEEISRKISDLQSKSAEEVLKWAFDAFGSGIALASSFQCEESVLIDMMHKTRGSDFRVFTLDTGRMNEETYEVMERMREKYRISIESQFPEREAVEKLEKEKGLFSFRQSIENRKECCGIRKVVPLNRVLSTLDAWITGLRKEQSVTRTDTPKIELDVPRKGMVKVNPLIDWSSDRVWDYIKKNQVPYNKLHDQGYPSIGCAPCTRAVQKGEDIRAGRWWWENPEQKECGLHTHQK
ncbi:MAG: phosphoadenosine phosphosulfate reductase [Elusimicrobia bacterium RIFCSPLOWO2_01_FULL_64_13]|nr:MAG: phosphoadenosine phosphosulfate reductase [Elusimicrobia bacterium RIFCSPHIGHO2_01_FULL_64_10]OGR94259.1 MAG: phosphoadenosine phosphosulfate reductase [Elusimicrobia bacterium RIFCSPLOWO2_01_FULL_64_13]